MQGCNSGELEQLVVAEKTSRDVERVAELQEWKAAENLYGAGQMQPVQAAVKRRVILNPKLAAFIPVLC
ncbi:hypothetical protein Ancab_023644 [Ancistrocladus abbreviatus]